MLAWVSTYLSKVQDITSMNVKLKYDFLFIKKGVLLSVFMPV